MMVRAYRKYAGQSSILLPYEEIENLKTDQNRTPSPRHSFARGCVKANERVSEAKGAVPCHCSSEQELRSICLTFLQPNIKTYCGRLKKSSRMRSVAPAY